MKISKILSTALCSLCALVVFFAAACTDNNPSGDKTPKLASPVVSLEHNVLVWDAVENADGYEVFENGTGLGEQAATSYTITKTTGGTYKYTVKALCSNGSYAASPLSEEITYVIPDSPTPLEKPVIRIAANGLITWTAVDHADGYNIYENGVYLTSTKSTSYKIMQQRPGSYNYQVTATCTLGYYTESAPSDADPFVVKMKTDIGVIYPADYPSRIVTVDLYSDEQLVASEPVVLADTNNEKDVVTAEFSVNAGNYTAKVSDLEEGYIATYARVTPNSSAGSLRIIAVTEENVAVLGSNTFTVKAGTVKPGEGTGDGGLNGENDDEVIIDDNSDGEESDNEVGISREYIFRATKTGIFSVTTEETKEMVITVNDKTLIDVNHSKTIGTFRAEEGEYVIIGATGNEAGEFSYNIVDEEVPQYVVVSPTNNYEGGWNYNDIEEDCSRYINITTPGTYLFCFTIYTLGNKTTVTIKIGEREYIFDGENFQKDIDLPAQNGIQLEITVSGADGRNISFAICQKYLTVSTAAEPVYNGISQDCTIYIKTAGKYSFSFDPSTLPEGADEAPVTVTVGEKDYTFSKEKPSLEIEITEDETLIEVIIGITGGGNIRLAVYPANA